MDVVTGDWSNVTGHLDKAGAAYDDLTGTGDTTTTATKGTATEKSKALYASRHPTTAMASGGIVTRPTVALIGESGPEAVIPLNGRTGGRSIQQTNNYTVVALTAAQIATINKQNGRTLATQLSMGGI
jgi:hypothetical protein